MHFIRKFLRLTESRFGALRARAWSRVYLRFYLRDFYLDVQSFLSNVFATEHLIDSENFFL